MSGKIFINYRRGDEPGFTQALFGRLEQAFPAERLFMDVDNIPPGDDFFLVLESQVAQCDALLAVIGKSWLDATDERGNRRLDDPNDFVRIEIESALRLGKRVIPVLVHEAKMPGPDELPEAIRPLARRNAVRLTHERFRADVQGLINALQRALEEVAAVHSDAVSAVEREHEPPKTSPPSRRVSLTVFVLGVALVSSVGVWLAYPHLKPAPEERTAVQSTPAPSRPSSSGLTPLSLEREQALKPGDSFNECVTCPEMIVVPAGSFTMGSPDSELPRGSNESPQHLVTIVRRFAVGEYTVTFDEWDACAAEGGCNRYKPADQQWGRGRRPVINVSWDDATTYVAWLSRKTGKPYRLLSEAEFEYAARAGGQTAYPWGNDIGRGNANCIGCGSQWDGKQTAPAGSFPANVFGLYDMAGNVWEWAQDCYHDNYVGAPSDGSAWVSGDCSRRVVRGGSWYSSLRYLRAAARNGSASSTRLDDSGIRVGRTLSP
jgi:formylglycine-generating enzyme required for sulfatase activity